MAVTNTVGATKYGMQLTFKNPSLIDSTKSYNGLNFPNENATARGNILQKFLYGTGQTSAEPSGLVRVIRAMDSGYSFEGAALTASNPVTFVET